MKISVFTANYNHGKYLKDNFEGLLAQTYQNWELVIVDDCSTDNSADIMREYAIRDARIKPIFLEKNGGAMAAFNLAVSLTKGELIYGSAADDYVCNPRFFEYAVLALKKKDAAGFFGTTLCVDDTSMKPISTMGFAPYSGFITPSDAMNAFLRGAMFVPGSSVILKRELFDRLGGFHDDLGPQTDYFINHALAAMNGIVFQYEVMTVFRLNPQSFGNSAKDNDYFKSHALVEKKLRELALPYPIAEELLMKWRQRIIHKRLLSNEGIESAYGIFDEYTGKKLAPVYKPARRIIDRSEHEGKLALKRKIRNKILCLFYALPIVIQKRIASFFL